MSEDDFLKQLALATIADNRARQVGTSVDFGMDDMPPLPDFLNRALWSPERWKQWEDSRRAYDIATKRAANIEKKRAERQAAALRAAKAEREAKRDANRQLKIERKQRKAERQADRDAVINSIRLGHVTVGQMAKATQRPPERLTRAIRWLLRNDRIYKASKRTYKL